MGLGGVVVSRSSWPKCDGGLARGCLTLSESEAAKRQLTFSPCWSSFPGCRPSRWDASSPAAGITSCPQQKFRPTASGLQPAVGCLPVYEPLEQHATACTAGNSTCDEDPPARGNSCEEELQRRKHRLRCREHQQQHVVAGSCLSACAT